MIIILLLYLRASAILLTSNDDPGPTAVETDDPRAALEKKPSSTGRYRGSRPRRGRLVYRYKGEPADRRCGLQPDLSTAEPSDRLA